MIKNTFNAKKIIKDIKQSIQLTFKKMAIKGVNKIQETLKRHNIDANVKAIIKKDSIGFKIQQKQPKQVDVTTEAAQNLQKQLGNIPIEMLNQESIKEIPDKLLQDSLNKITEDIQNELNKNLKKIMG